MLDFVEGDLVARSPGQVTVQTGGLGLLLSVPLSTYDRLPASGRVRLWAHLVVREDALQIFGFSSLEERELFLLLNTVKGIGPRLALKILSGVRVADFVAAVGRGETALLCRIPGIGRKTAERLTVELKDAVSRLPAEGGAPADAGAADAVVALIKLGAQRGEAEKAVGKARAALPPGAATEELVRECLRRGFA
ncbi:MAG: Holliday junction branch migration protein RuvA [Planctomycetes bacterium]|jgi:Holliday junction DNA helicase RuvA|nr:Holliday junction branch migration protein RuvA [Planctomycetota bacterium]